MCNKIEATDITARYYFSNNIINRKFFDPNKIKIDEESNKNIHIYYIGYVRIKKRFEICKN